MSEFQALDIVNAKLERLLAVGGLDREAFLEIGNLLKSEIHENFRAGGRPVRWIPSQRVQKKGGQTLRLSGHLLNSFQVEATDKSVQVGSNLPYARIHNFGGDIIRHAQSRLAVDFRRPKKGKFAGKQLFAKKGTGTIRKNVTVGQYTITIDRRPFDYISPKGEGYIVSAAARRLIVGASNA